MVADWPACRRANVRQAGGAAAIERAAIRLPRICGPAATERAAVQKAVIWFESNGVQVEPVEINTIEG